MATTFDSPPTTHSPRAPGFSGDGDGDGGAHCPQFRRRSNLHSPWVQVVRGDPESVPAVPRSPSSSSSPRPSSSGQTHFSDSSSSKASSSPLPALDNSEVAEALPAESSDSSNSNAARAKKPAWNKPSNSVVDVNCVIDASSWPALSESTRACPKSPSDSSKNIPDAAVSVSEGPATPLSPQKQGTSRANSSSTPNHTVPVRQRSMKHGGGFGRGPSWRSFGQPSLPPAPPPPPPPPPPCPVFRMPQNRYGNFIPVVSDLSTREAPFRGNDPESRTSGGLLPHGAIANGHLVQRNTSRRGNFGSQHRGDGSHRKSYGSWRGQISKNYEWNSPRTSTFRDVHIQPQSAPPRGLMSPPPNAAAFITPQTVRPFGIPMGATDMTSPVYIVPALPSESFRGFPFVTHAPAPPTMLFTVPDPSLSTLLVNQIDYYFSDANLMADKFLKSNMDDKGWVPITLIASFRRVQNLTNNIQLILDSLRNSTVVEVQGGKLRKRNEWMKWIPTSDKSPTDSSLQSPGGSNNDPLSSCFQKVTLSEVPVNKNRAMGKEDPHIDAATGNCASENLTSHYKSLLLNGTVTDQDTFK